MPLVVPILRLTLLFWNIWDTFKTLKPPRPSTRYGGQPSVRAVTQRKRDMKGCLAVWLVWCCLATYERTVDGLVCLFVPFYDEIKSVVLLFFILTRARGAEPIYLHIIRPIVKPYVSTLDTLLDLTCMVGDIILLATTFPIRLGINWWRKRHGQQTEAGYSFANRNHGSNHRGNYDDERPRLGNGRSSSQVSNRRPSIGRNRSSSRSFISSNSNVRPSSESRRPSYDAQGSTRSRRQALDDGNREEAASASRRAISPPVGKENAERTQPPVSRSPYEIWVPPPSSYDQTDDKDEETPSVHPQEPFFSNLFTEPTVRHERRLTEEEKTDEWRQYPAFPSAYPPTPLPASTRLPTPQNIDVMSPAPRRAADVVLFPAIPENEPIEEQPDFRPSLLPPREPLKPGYDGGLSDDSILGAQHFTSNSSDSTIEDDRGHEADEDEEEDDFDVTLRTPLRPNGTIRSQARPRTHVMSMISATSSMGSRSAALTSADEGTSMTRTDSESSASYSLSDLTSAAGHKRSFTQAKDDVKSRARMYEMAISKESKHGAAATIRAKPNSQTLKMSQRQIFKGMVAASGADSESDDDSSEPPGLENKRRRVLGSLRDTSVEAPRNIAAKKSIARLPSKRSAQTRNAQLAKSLEPPAAATRTSSRNVTRVTQAMSRRNAASSSAPDLSLVDPVPNSVKPTLKRHATTKAK